MFKVYLGLGSNMGSKEQNLNLAYELIEQKVGKIIQKSSLYHSKAWGLINQENYLNSVVLVETNLFPLNILNEILAIEKTMGRVRIEKWGPRIIDIDLLFFENYHFTTPQLTIPHPYITSRKFVLIPLSEISENFVHPICQKNIQDLLLFTEDNSEIFKI